MAANQLYDDYLSSLLSIVEQVEKEAALQGSIAQEERNSISEIEKNYMQLTETLRNAHNTVQKQYKSVWESCSQREGLKRPSDQHPASTELSWNEAVSLQEKAADKIRKWFDEKTRQAVLEKQKQLREIAAQKAAEAAAIAEAERKKAEEAARLDREKGEALIEELKRKHKKKVF